MSWQLPQTCRWCFDEGGKWWLGRTWAHPSPGGTAASADKKEGNRTMIGVLELLVLLLFILILYMEWVWRFKNSQLFRNQMPGCSLLCKQVHMCRTFSYLSHCNFKHYWPYFPQFSSLLFLLFWHDALLCFREPLELWDLYTDSEVTIQLKAHTTASIQAL